MAGTVLDTSVYITAIRGGNLGLLGQRRFSVQSPLWLSVVVLEELYAGADPALQKKLEKFEHEFDKIGRLLVPILSDWTLTGNVLGKIGEKYGYELIGRARLANDTLRAASVARRGLKLLTVNAKDFARTSESMIDRRRAHGFTSAMTARNVFSGLDAYAPEVDIIQRRKNEWDLTLNRLSKHGKIECR